jgi:serine/threonine protein kinase
MTIEPGTDIGRYHILEQLGEGGMAVVYKAYDTRLERDVAIKIIRTDQFAPAQLERVLKRFEHEAKALAHLDHLHIVKVYDFGEYEDAPYLVMPYLPGGTLKERMGQPIPWEDAAKLLLPIADALNYAHGRGVVHRDIKPSNILITESGEVMVSDFGIAKILESEETLNLTTTGMGIGTPEYMSPEQAEGNKVDNRSDLYSLGIVMYELLTGRKPFTADTPMAVIVKQMHDPLPNPSQYIPDMPAGMEQVLFKTLAKNPKDRYANMAEFGNALKKIIHTAPPVEGREKQGLFPTKKKDKSILDSRGEGSAKGKSRSWFWAGGAIVVVLVLLLIIFLSSGKVGQSEIASTTSSTRKPIVTLNPTSSIVATKESPGEKSQNTSTTTPVKTLIPDVLYKAIDEAKVLFIDNFNNSALTGWANWGGFSSNNKIENGILTFYGRIDTIPSIGRNANLKENMAVLALIKLDPGSLIQFKCISGIYPSQSWRDWGIEINSYIGLGTLVTKGSTRLGGKPLIEGNLKYASGRWYYFMLWIKEPLNFVARVWDKENPDQFAQTIYQMDQDWNIGGGWGIQILSDTGKVEIDSYKEIELNSSSLK